MIGLQNSLHRVHESFTLYKSLTQDAVKIYFSTICGSYTYLWFCTWKWWFNFLQRTITLATASQPVITRCYVPCAAATSAKCFFGDRKKNPQSYLQNISSVLQFKKLKISSCKIDMFQNRPRSSGNYFIVNQELNKDDNIYIWNECSPQNICSIFNNTLQTWNTFFRPSARQVNVSLWKNGFFLILNEKNLQALFLTV